MTHRPTDHSGVTALVLAYNQAGSLRSALDSVRRQSIFDRISVIVSDDASTDGTHDLARTLVSSYPDARVRRNETNLGVMEHYRRAIAEVRTEFVAIIEGDDEWTNTQKLERQRAFLDLFPNLHCVFTGYTVCFTKDGRRSRQPNLFGGRRSGLVHFEEILQDNPGASFTNHMYRTRALAEVLSRDPARSGYDWLVNLLIADSGPIGYLEGDFATYNVHEGGRWSGMSDSEKIRLKIGSLKAIEPLLAPKHAAAVRQACLRLVAHESEASA